MKPLKKMKNSKKKNLKEVRALRNKEIRSLNKKILEGKRSLYINIDDNHDTTLELQAIHRVVPHVAISTKEIWWQFITFPLQWWRVTLICMHDQASNDSATYVWRGVVKEKAIKSSGSPAILGINNRHLDVITCHNDGSDIEMTKHFFSAFSKRYW